MKGPDPFFHVFLFSILFSKTHFISGFTASPSARRCQIQPTRIPLPPPESTQLQVAVDSSTIMASMALLGSSAVGVQFDKWLPSSGIFGTLLTAALLSNVLPMVPLRHPLYELCWSWILPGSLALLLLGYRQTGVDSSNSVKVARKACTSQQQIIVVKAIARVAGPFLLASIGSLLGCWISYQIAMAGGWFSTAAQAGAAASCLAASYVGGSVNLFATAKIIQAPTSLLSSIATADLIAMALYFSVLSSTIEWKWLKSLFFTDEDIRETQSGVPAEHATLYVSENLEDRALDEISTARHWSVSNTKALSTIPPLFSLTWMILTVANRVEAYASRWIPGTACVVIAMVAPLLQSVLFRSKWIQERSREWTLTASTVADWFLFLFFASIGVGVDLMATVRHGPACLLVSLLALNVHLLVTVIGSYLCLPTKRWGIALEDLWIASNAAIGGPATAAAFCSRIKCVNPSALWGRTVAATVWGVVGYAIGTMVGVGLYRSMVPTT